LSYQKFLKSPIQEASTFDKSFFYMSPEILSGSNYSYPTDIWSLGIAFQELQLLMNHSFSICEVD
jgi:serine/threonine protein kinase